jgi:hypothetical protein
VGKIAEGDIFHLATAEAVIGSALVSVEATAGRHRLASGSLSGSGRH